MRKKAILVLILSIFLFSILNLIVQSSQDEAPLIPMRDFFRNPEKIGFSLSPNGEYWAFLQPWQNRLNIHVQKIGEEKITRVTDATERDITGYLWASNNRIVYAQDQAGDENFKLYAVDIDGSDRKALTPFEEVKVGLVDDLKNNPEEMLLLSQVGTS